MSSLAIYIFKKKKIQVNMGETSLYNMHYFKRSVSILDYVIQICKCSTCVEKDFLRYVSQ